MHAGGALPIEGEVGGIEAGLADDGGDDGGVPVRLRRVGLQAGLRHGLPRGDHGKLRAAVQQGQAPRAEVLRRVEAGNLRGDAGGQARWSACR